MNLARAPNRTILVSAIALAAMPGREPQNGCFSLHGIPATFVVLGAPLQRFLLSEHFPPFLLELAHCALDDCLATSPDFRHEVRPIRKSRRRPLSSINPQLT